MAKMLLDNWRFHINLRVTMTLKCMLHPSFVAAAALGVIMTLFHYSENSHNITPLCLCISHSVLYCCFYHSIAIAALGVPATLFYYSQKSHNITHLCHVQWFIQVLLLLLLQGSLRPYFTTYKCHITLYPCVCACFIHHDLILLLTKLV